MNYLPIILGLIPSFAWLIFYLEEDPHPEPKPLIFETFLAGAASTFIVLGLQYVFNDQVQPYGIAQYSFLSFLGLAAIEELFKRKAHIATTHNELIKDKRFVLVGRGLYALAEWGYSAGVVKDVLRDILEKHGPLTREEIIDKVRKERYVKDNTIIVNLQDPNLFKRLSNGAYMLAAD